MLYQAPVNIGREFFEELGGNECEANGRDVKCDNAKKLCDGFRYRVKILK